MQQVCNAQRARYLSGHQRTATTSQFNTNPLHAHRCWHGLPCHAMQQRLSHIVPAIYLYIAIKRSSHTLERAYTAITIDDISTPSRFSLALWLLSGGVAGGWPRLPVCPPQLFGSTPTLLLLQAKTKKPTAACLAQSVPDAICLFWLGHGMVRAESSETPSQRFSTMNSSINGYLIIRSRESRSAAACCQSRLRSQSE